MSLMLEALTWALRAMMLMFLACAALAVLDVALAYTRRPRCPVCGMPHRHGPAHVRPERERLP
jgi:hypothetical protein